LEPVSVHVVTERLTQLLERHPPATTPPVPFRGAQYDLGLAWVHFPPGLGGLGLAGGHQRRVDEAVVDAGGELCWPVNPIGYGMAAPTLMTYLGAEADRLLRPLFTGEQMWCQLFSEPGAGSDVAALSTRAVRDGDEWVVNGQKDWTSLAHLSRYGLLLARTDPDLPKHAGMTYFVVDMQSPGVEVRPLRQATGDAEFNEVYFNDVRIPDASRLGPVGAGWKVALTTLVNERVAIGGRSGRRGEGAIASAVQLWRQNGGPAEHRERLLDLWVRAEVLRLTNARAKELAQAGTPGPEGSIGKLAGAELSQHVLELCVDLMGSDGLLYPASSYDPDNRGRHAYTDVRQQFLRSRAMTIEGGTSEVLRNILAERVLGMPGEARVDKDVPWTQVPRS
jgi:alkylation response protein AidB-like acyl-CoA dehydrogenase